MWEEKISNRLITKFPINDGTAPGIPKDCRIKVARQTGLREIHAVKLRELIVRVMLSNKDETPEFITLQIQSLIDAY